MRDRTMCKMWGVKMILDWKFWGEVIGRFALASLTLATAHSVLLIQEIILNKLDVAVIGGLNPIHFFVFGFVLIVWIFLPLLKTKELEEEPKEVQEEEEDDV